MASESDLRERLACPSGWDLGRAHDALKAVVELHEGRTDRAHPYCMECSSLGYPCATLRTIAAKLGVK